MKKSKRLIALMLTMIMVFSLCVAPVFAESAVGQDGVQIGSKFYTLGYIMAHTDDFAEIFGPAKPSNVIIKLNGKAANFAAYLVVGGDFHAFAVAHPVTPNPTEIVNPDGTCVPVVDELTVVSVSALEDINVDFGAAQPELPATVEILLSDGTFEEVPVIWAGNYNGNVAETYTFTGTLDLSGLENVAATNIKASIKVIVDEEVIIPAQGYVLKVEAAEEFLFATESNNTYITATLKDKNGNVVDYYGTVQFSKTYGSLAQKEVAMERGVARVMLAAQASATPITSTITAKIINAPAPYVGIVGQTEVQFVPEGVDYGFYVTPVRAESNQADRLFVTFDAPIDADTFAEAYLAEMASHWRAVIRLDGAYEIPILYWDDSEEERLVGVKNLAPNVLEFILNTDNAYDIWGYTEQIEPLRWLGLTEFGYLRDNVHHTITFLRDIGDLVNGSYDKHYSFILTDALKPYVQGIEGADDQLTVSVRFSEAMAEDIMEKTKRNPEHDLVHAYLDQHRLKVPKINPHFLIDGRAIQLVNMNNFTEAQQAVLVNAAKQVGQLIATDIQVGSLFEAQLGPDEMVDARNIITIELDYRFALDEGPHTLQAVEAADWAAMTDPNNYASTQSFSFNVNPELSAPVPRVIVQSPEQWVLSFNKGIFVNDNDLSRAFEIHIGDAYNTLLKQGEEEDYRIVRIGNSFLIEFNQDWTVYFDDFYPNGSKEYTNRGINYFTSSMNPFTLTVNKDCIRDKYGNYTPKTVIDVGLLEDRDLPTVVDYNYEDSIVMTHHSNVPGQSRFNVTVEVEMSEPIQLNEEVATVPLTPAVLQGNVPVTFFEFVKGDVTIKGHADYISDDDYDFTVVNEKELTPGTWELKIYNLADDIGWAYDTTMTLDIVIPDPPPVETGSAILWAAFEDDHNHGRHSLNAIGASGDRIYVKFADVMKAGFPDGVDELSNYLFNGVELPEGTYIEKGIHFCTDDWDGITIVMPKNTWNGEKKDEQWPLYWTCILNVVNDLKSAAGKVVDMPNEIELFDTFSWYTDSKFEAVYENAGAHLDYSDSPVIMAGYTDILKYYNDFDGLGFGADGKVDFVGIMFDHGYDIDPNDMFYVNGEQWEVLSFNTFVSAKGLTTDQSDVVAQRYSRNGGILDNLLILFAENDEDQIVGTGDINVQVKDGEGNILINAKGRSHLDLAGPAIVGVDFLQKNKIEVTFSEAIDDNTVQISDFVISEGHIIGLSTGNFANDNVFEFTLDQNVGLNPGEEFAIRFADMFVVYDLSFLPNGNIQNYDVIYKQLAE